ncbi:50S ribosomal protein L32 [Candidatus Daviesbacteria bacterium]|nr:50S ribosomal protein L32 [Candidatus Daviesbacteria bacterium]
MPQEPKRRHSKARKRTRRAAIKLTALSLVVCKNCGTKTRPHMACVECGFYKSTKA